MALAKLTIMIIHYLIVLCQSIFLLFISLSLSVPWMESRSFLFSCRAISVCWIWECTWNTINLPYLLCPKECLFFLWCALSRWQMSRHHPRKTACIYGRLPWSCLTGRSETMCISLKMIMTASFGIIPHRCPGGYKLLLFGSLVGTYLCRKRIFRAWIHISMIFCAN